MPPLDFKIKQPGATLMVALSAAFPLTGMAANAGRIDFASGDVQALAPDGRSRTLAKGATFDSGETIETGNNGRAQLRFTDGAQVSLQPKSQFRIDDYNFSGKPDGSEKGLFSLLKGGLRTITGWVGRTNRDNYRVTTAVATIGIRGTEYSVTYGNSITVTTGEGVIEICNTAGCMILNSGETAHVPNSDTRPSMIDKKADLPPPPPQDEVQFSVAENTNSSGEAEIISGGGLMSSGSGYEMRGRGINSFSQIENSSISGTATFSGNVLTSMAGGSTATATGSPTGNADGTIGWGLWDTSTLSSSSYNPVSEFHYVVGMPTASADINSLSGTVNYSLLGATTPSTDGASVGSVSSASLQVNFAGGTATIPISGFTLTTTTGFSLFNTAAVNNASVGSPLFSGSNMNCSGAGCNSACASGSFSGFFAGSNAARAGITYHLNAYSTSGNVWGAVAFTQ